MNMHQHMNMQLWPKSSLVTKRRFAIWTFFCIFFTFTIKHWSINKISNEGNFLVDNSQNNFYYKTKIRNVRTHIRFVNLSLSLVTVTARSLSDHPNPPRPPLPWHFSLVFKLQVEIHQALSLFYVAIGPRLSASSRTLSHGCWPSFLSSHRILPAKETMIQLQKYCTTGLVPPPPHVTGVVLKGSLCRSLEFWVPTCFGDNAYLGQSQSNLHS